MKTSSSSHDLYARLGIAKDSTKQEHPDKNPNNPEANTRFQKAVEAYSVLTDDCARCLYDFFGYNSPIATQTSYTSSTATTGDYYSNSSHYSQTTTYSTNTPNNIPSNTNNTNYSFLNANMPPPSSPSLPIHSSIPANCEIKSEFSSSNSNVNNTNNLFSSNPNHNVNPISNLPSSCPTAASYTQHYSFTNFSLKCPQFIPKTHTIYVDCKLNELYSGCTKQLKLKEVSSKKYACIEVEVPKGSCNGTILKTPTSIKDKLDYDPKYIQFVVKEIEHKKYKRINNNLIYEVELNWKEALLGTEINIPTIDGRIIKKHIDGLKSSNSEMTIPKCGMIYFNEEKNSFEKGDMIVKFNVVFDNLNEEMKNKLKNILL